MAANPEGPIELAMTHLPVGSEGRQVCHRPETVRLTAVRLLRWRDDPETCQSCQSAHARWLRHGMSLCASCRHNRHEREGGLELLDQRIAKQASESVQGDGLSGLAIVFDQWSVDLGGFKERIRPAAINRTIQEQIDVRALWNHNTDLTLGRLSAGTLTAEKRSGGYWIRLVAPSWASAQMETVERRDVTGQSFAFRTVDDEWDFDHETPLRDVLDMRVSETSGVSFPAYPQTTLRVERDSRAATARARLRLAG